MVRPRRHGQEQPTEANPLAASSHRSASSSASGHAPQMQSQVASVSEPMYVYIGGCRKAAQSGADNDEGGQESHKKLRIDVSATQASSSASSHAASQQE